MFSLEDMINLVKDHKVAWRRCVIYGANGPEYVCPLVLWAQKHYNYNVPSSPPIFVTEFLCNKCPGLDDYFWGFAVGFNWPNDKAQPPEAKSEPFMKGWVVGKQLYEYCEKENLIVDK